MKFVVLNLLTCFSCLVLADDWETSAQKDMNSPNGKVYAQVVSKFIAKQSVSIDKECINDQTAFDFVLYFKILNNGSISEKSSTYTTPAITCLLENYSKLRWPTPPKSPFVYTIEMLGKM